MSGEIYKRARPSKLEHVVGNEPTVKALAGMIERKNVPHTILFHGPSGAGKTTLARILRRAIGCHKTDVAEINCAQSRGIDVVRDLDRRSRLSPTAGTSRVFILDEVANLTSEAQEGALKLLEDTPKHVYFFLCTTDPAKLKKAILTRCTKLPVAPLTDAQAQELVKRTAKAEGIKLTSDDLGMIVDQANGSARTLLVILDKIANLDPKDRAKAIVEELEQDREAIDLCRALIARKPWAEVSKIVRGLTAEPESVRHAVMGYASSILCGGDKRPGKKDDHAYNVLLAFESKAFYDSKKSGLVRACYEALHA